MYTPPNQRLKISHEHETTKISHEQETTKIAEKNEDTNAKLRSPRPCNLSKVGCNSKSHCQ